MEAGEREIDFEDEGLLDGVEGEARASRLALLCQLWDEGVPLAELREAVEAGRLTLLPVERSLVGEGKRFSPREVAEISGMDLELLRRFRSALGVPYGDPDERIGTEADLAAALRTKMILDAGLPAEEVLRNARTVGISMGRIAEAQRELIVRNLTAPGDTERDVANRLAGAAEGLVPLVSETLAYAYEVNLLEQIRRDVIAAADLESGAIGGVVERSVCFADLVEFTSLGEEVPPEELGLVAGRLEEMATAVAEAPVRLVKTIGDAAMLVSPEAEPLIGAALAIVEAAADEGEDFPLLRAGIATGPTLPQSGDYYGRAVNLASRITGVARPGSVLVDTPTREAAGETFAYSRAGERHLKGIEGRTKLYRARREPKRRGSD